MINVEDMPSDEEPRTREETTKTLRKGNVGRVQLGSKGVGCEECERELIHSGRLKKNTMRGVGEGGREVSSVNEE